MNFILYKNENEKNFLAVIAGLVLAYFFGKYILMAAIFTLVLVWPAVWMGLIFLAFGVAIAGIAGLFQNGLPR